MTNTPGTTGLKALDFLRAKEGTQNTDVEGEGAGEITEKRRRAIAHLQAAVAATTANRLSSELQLGIKAEAQAIPEVEESQDKLFIEDSLKIIGILQDRSELDNNKRRVDTIKFLKRVSPA